MEPMHYIRAMSTWPNTPLRAPGTGALCVQRDGGESHSGESKDTFRIGVNRNTKTQQFVPRFSYGDSRRGTVRRQITAWRSIR